MMALNVRLGQTGNNIHDLNCGHHGDLTMCDTELATKLKKSVAKWPLNCMHT